ncbi:DUF1275 domain-containing protein [Nonomuraea sp. K274]|uniref:DUF1275 domain-containing protein n=1 Tax=Nonomuraea cypriaca TaxID=1187855 RepID=A0A931A863_9ACTN|nr:YoaK family protein [Nonomuraea cypriaca]MBF8185763.1 DUF1275 domain-containing protein [Nonomuraea cypriaca]
MKEPASGSPPAARRGLPLTALAVVLTVGTGAVDVASFAVLGGVFSSVMTGNLVVLGFAVGTAAVAQVLSTATAVIGYALGVAAGALITGRSRPAGPVWPPRVTVTLGTELLVLLVFATGWELTGARPTGAPLYVLLALAAMAMGLQSAAMRGLGGQEAVSTTYLTGTLTGVISALLTPTRLGRSHLRGMAILAAVAAGAASGALVITHVPAALPALPLATVAVVVTAATVHHRRCRHTG